MSHRTKEVLCAIAINSLITLVLGYCFEQSLWRILFMEFIMLFLNMIIFLVCLPTRGEKLALKEEVIMFGHYLTQSKWAFIALILLTIVYALISPESVLQYLFSKPLCTVVYQFWSDQKSHECSS